MDVSALSPAQQRVIDDLMARGQERPTFDPSLPVQLRDELEAALAPIADRLAVRELVVTKRLLAQVHACEAHQVAEAAVPFAWTVVTARGTIAHKAVELSTFMQGATAIDLVEGAVTHFLGDAGAGNGLAEWLATATDVELAGLKSDVNNQVVAFLECWPPLARSWRPRGEAPMRVAICDDRIVLRAKCDLALGVTEGTTAKVLLVDFKTGRPAQHHLDDLRFYALVHAIVVGVPPFRVASYYLDSGDFRHEDVDLDTLGVAVRRTADGARKLAELLLREREPEVRPGPSCRWCVARHDCHGAVTWEAMRSAAAETAGELPDPF